MRDGYLSVEEYFQVEEASDARHEYLAGGLYALAGATRRHNRIAGNVFSRLFMAARGGPCRVSMSDVKLRATEEVFYYPDIMVACEPEPENPLIEEGPCLVVEVTSPSTERIDRGEKVAVYERIPTLVAYIIVHQGQSRVERFDRSVGESRWAPAEIVGKGIVIFPCPEIELSLDEIYEGTGVT